MPSFARFAHCRDVQEDVLRQHGGQSGENLAGLPTPPLKADDVGLEEDGASIPEIRHGLRRERHVGVALDRNAELLGRGLKEVAVARRALRVQLEVDDAALAQQDQLDVLAADVDDDLRIVVESQRRFGVGDRLDERGVRLQHVAQNVLGVSRRSGAEDREPRAVRFHRGSQAAGDVDGVADRIAARELVGLAEHAPVGRQQHGLRRRRAAVDAQEGRDALGRPETRLNEWRAGDGPSELGQFGVGGAQTAPAHSRSLLQPASTEVVLEPARAGIDADRVVLAPSELDGAKGAEILRVGGNADQVLDRHAFRRRDVALAPGQRDVVAPRLAHAADERVGSAEQQHHRPERLAAREHGEVLLDDGVEERGHQLVRRDSALLQAVDVGFGEHAAFPGDGVKREAVVAVVAERVRRDAELRRDLVDDGARAAGALVVHRRQLEPAIAGPVAPEDDDLRVLAAELDDGVHFGVKLLDGQADRGALPARTSRRRAARGLLPPEPVRKTRSRPAASPTSASIRRRNASTFSDWRAS